jgi:hypothetical protein
MKTIIRCVVAVGFSLLVHGNAQAYFTIHYTSVATTTAPQLFGSALSGAQIEDFSIASTSSSTITMGSSNGTINTNDVVYNFYNSGSVIYSCVLTVLGADNVTPIFSAKDPSYGTVDFNGVVSYVGDGTATFGVTIGRLTRGIECPMLHTHNSYNTIFNSLVSGSLGSDIFSEISAMISGKTPSASTQNIYSSTDDVNHVYTRNPNIFTGAVDLTAIPVWSDWDSPPPTGSNPYGGARFNGILVTPDILIQSNHAYIPNGTTVYFVKNDNTTVSRTITASAHVGVDIQVMKLSSAVPSGITPAKVFASGSVGISDGTDGTKMTKAAISYAHPLVLFTNQYRSLSIGSAVAFDSDVVAIIQPGQYIYSPNTSQYAGWYLPIASGDSGSPILMVINGQAVALGTWYYKSGYFPDGASDIVGNISAINAAITSLGGQTLTPVDLSGFPTY